METKVIIENIDDYELNKIYDFYKKTAENLNYWKGIKDAKTILIKPNMLGAYSPEKAVTTHPKIIEAMVKLLLENNKTVIIGDSAGGTVDIKKVWEKTGILKIAEKYGINLIKFGEKITNIKNGNYEFFIDSTIFEVDSIINMCKYKTHSLMLFTGAVKNIYGVIPGLIKSEYHKKLPDPKDFAKMLTVLYQIVKPKISLNIMDGILGMEGEGPSAGKPRNFGMIFISDNAPSIDYVAAKMMGFNPSEIPLIKYSLEADNINFDKIEIDPKWSNFKFKKVRLGSVTLRNRIISNAPKIFTDLFAKMFYYNPDFTDECQKCGLCVESCPVKAMELKPNDKHPKIKFDICIKCLCCQELCPFNAVFVKKSFLSKIIFGNDSKKK
jgi:uncharacterized protein (DUF362 family)/NAD-dependent dihydropyrimidine dehydrogenase PreA subunit